MKESGLDEFLRQQARLIKIAIDHLGSATGKDLPEEEELKESNPEEQMIPHDHAAVLLGKSTKTLNRWCVGPNPQIAGAKRINKRRIMVPLSEIERIREIQDMKTIKR